MVVNNVLFIFLNWKNRRVFEQSLKQHDLADNKEIAFYCYDQTTHNIIIHEALTICCSNKQKVRPLDQNQRKEQYEKETEEFAFICTIMSWMF